MEHVEVLQRKFDEFQKDMEAKELRVIKVLDLADRLVKDRHPEVETINRGVVHSKKFSYTLEFYAKIPIGNSIRAIQNFAKIQKIHEKFENSRTP